MKKKGLLFTCVLLAAMLLLVFCGCSSYGGVKSAFEKEGYTESEDFGAYESQIKNAIGGDYQDVCTVHLLVKDLKSAIIFEFDSTEEMNEAIAGSETLKGLIKDAQKSDYVSGTCVLLYIPVITPSEVVDIFKSTK